MNLFRHEESHLRDVSSDHLWREVYARCAANARVSLPRSPVPWDGTPQHLARAAPQRLQRWCVKAEQSRTLHPRSAFAIAAQSALRGRRVRPGRGPAPTPVEPRSRLPATCGATTCFRSVTSPSTSISGATNDVADGNTRVVPRFCLTSKVELRGLMSRSRVSGPL